MLKKIALSVFVFVFLFSSLSLPFARSAKAQIESYSWYHQDYFDWFDKVYNPDNEDEIFGERYTTAQVEWILYGVFTFFITHISDPETNWCVMNTINDMPSGSSVDDIRSQILTDCGLDILDWVTGFVDAIAPDESTPAPEDFGIPPTVYLQNTEWYSVFTSRQLSTYGYVSGALSRLNIVPEAQAQTTGFGYGAMESMVSNIWSASRNVAYFFMVIAIIVMAFMIMFRTKIAPQTVVTVQSALPKIIITTILITFSFAIAGFMIDLMYVVIGLLAALINASGVSTGLTWSDLFEMFTQRSIITHLLVYFIEWCVVVLIAGLSAGVGWGIAFVMSLMIVILVFLILILVLLIAVMRILWMLIKNYISVIFQVAFAPIIIVGGAMGIGPGFGGWLKNLAATLMVYPAACLVLFLAFLLLAPALPDFSGVPGIGENLNDLIARAGSFNILPDAIGESSDFWDPPLTMGVGAFELMMCFASLSVLMLLPKIADIVKSMFAGKPFAYGSAVGEGIAPMVAAGAAGWGLARGFGRDVVRGYFQDPYLRAISSLSPRRRETSSAGSTTLPPKR